MYGKEESFRNVNMEEEIQKIKWYKEDLDKGGWREISRTPGAVFWIKSFHDEEVPTKVLFEWDMPMTAHQFTQHYNPTNFEFRKKSSTYKDLEALEVYPDSKGMVVYSRFDTPWPLYDRDFVLFEQAVQEVDWYGTQSFMHVIVNAWHPSKPADTNGTVRAYNGGNLLLVTPDEKEPEISCKVFGLSCNNYNGWIPKRNVEWLFARAIPRAFIGLRESIIKYFNEFQK